MGLLHGFENPHEGHLAFVQQCMAKLVFSCPSHHKRLDRASCIAGNNDNTCGIAVIRKKNPLILNGLFKQWLLFANLNDLCCWCTLVQAMYSGLGKQKLSASRPKSEISDFEYLGSARNLSSILLEDDQPSVTSRPTSQCNM